MTRIGNWMQLVSGKPFWPLDPRPEEIDITDIAWALSMQARYGGHSLSWYSVAEHCVHVSKAVPSEYALWGLLHDAPEAYMVDVPRPIKAHLGGYTKIEHKLMQTIALRFGLSKHIEMPLCVREADCRIVSNERAAIMAPSILAWEYTGEPLPNVNIECWPQIRAFTEFIDRYAKITGAVI